MILTTSQSIEGRPVSEYLDIVSYGTFATLPKIKDMGKGEWRAGVDDVNKALAGQASSLGADAVIAIRYEYAPHSVGYMVFAAGTAVKLG